MGVKTMGVSTSLFTIGGRMPATFGGRVSIVSTRVTITPNTQGLGAEDFGLRTMYLILPQGGAGTLAFGRVRNPGSVRARGSVFTYRSVAAASVTALYTNGAGTHALDVTVIGE